MAYYLFLADRHGTGSGARWAIMGIAVKVAQSVRPAFSYSIRLRSRTLAPSQIGLRKCVCIAASPITHRTILFSRPR
jgi:hypothetical protein